MSNVIDSRIVEMKFDNKQFESAVSTSMGTIAKLKESLNFEKNGSGFLQGLANTLGKVDLSPIATAAEAAGQKFSALEAVAVGALMKIGAQAVETGERLVKSLSIDQITEGWSKYEDKTTAVQTIMAATADQFTDTGVQMEYVNGQLEKLNWFTDETSYNFVDMVGNIGKFTSNGIKLDSAVTAMQGIANWAAISGQNAQTASRAMYNLSQAIGTGSVKLIDWRSIENANMATQEFKKQVLEAAAAEGSLTKAADGTYKTLKGTTVTVQDFNSALSEGWFNKDVLTTVLDKYGAATNKLYDLAEASDLTATDILKLVEAQQKGTLTNDMLSSVLEDSSMNVSEFKQKIQELAGSEYEFGIKAFRAAQEAKTFTDAIDATKDAVSTGWMKTFELMFGDYEHAKVLWTDVANGLWDIFAAGSEARNELLKDWGRSNWENLTKDISKAGISMNEFELSLRRTLGLQGIDIKKLEEEFGSIGAAIEKGAIDAEQLGHAVSDTIEGIITGKGGKASLQSAEDKLKEIQDVVHQVWSGELGNGDDRKKALEEMGYEYDAIQALVAKGSEYQLELQDVLGLISDTELEALGLGEEEIAQLRAIQADWERLSNLSGESGRQMLADSITNSLGALADALKLVRNLWSRTFGSMTGDQLRDLTQRLRDFTASLRLYEEDGETLTTRGAALANVLSKVFEAAKNVFGLFKNVARIVGQFAKAMEPAVTAAKELLKVLLDLFNASLGKINEFLGGLDFSKEFGSFGKTIASVIELITQKIDPLVAKVNNIKIGEKLANAGEKAAGAKDKIKDFFDNLSNGIKDGTLFQNILDKMALALQKIKEFFQPAIDKLKEFWTSLKGNFDFSNVKNAADAVKALTSGLVDIFGGAWKGLKEGVDRLDLSFGGLLKTFLGFKIGNKVLSSVLGNNNGLGSTLKQLATSAKELIETVGEKGLLNTILGRDGEKSGGKFKEIATSLLMLGGALIMVAGALAIITALDPEKVALAFNALILTLGSVGGLLIGFAEVMKVLGINALTLVPAAAAILITSVALLALAGALALFTKVSQMEGVEKGFKNLAFSLGIVVGALMLLSTVGPVCAAAAVAIGVVAAALIVLAGALALFTLVVDMENTTTALLAMFTTLALVVGGLMLLSSVGPVCLAAAAAIMVVSVALIALAGALALFTVISTMQNISDGLLLMAGSLAVLVVGLAALSTVGPMVLVAAAALAMAAVAVIAVAAGLAAAGIAIGVLGAGLTVLIAGVGTAVGQAIGAIGEGIGTALSAIGDGLGGIFSGIGEGIAAGIEAIGAGIATANGLIGVSVEGLGTSIGNGFQNVANGIDIATRIVQMAIDRLGTGVGNTIDKVSEKIAGAIDKIGEAIKTAAENISGVGDSIASIGDGIEKFGVSVRTLGGLDLIGIAKGLVDFAKAIKKLNSNAFVMDPSGVVAYATAIANLTSLIDTVEQFASTLETRMFTLGENMGANLANGVATSSVNAANAVVAMGDAAFNIANSYYDAFFVAGANMAIGMANGIISEEQTVYNAASSVASNAAQASRKAADEHSPSKVFAKIGEFMTLGLAKGIEDKEGSVIDSAELIAKSAIDSVKSLTSGGLDNEFTITPVIDLTNAREGAMQLDSMLSNRSASYQLMTNDINGMLNVREIDQIASNRNASTDLDGIYRRIEALANHLDNLQVVLDSGQLVGATSAKMDSQFGIMAMRRGRGN